MLKLNKRVKYKTNHSRKIYRGSVLGIKDSSLIVNVTETRFDDIEDITLIKLITAPLKIIGVCLAPFTSGYSLALLIRYCNPGFHSMGRWKFVTPTKTGIDTAATIRYQRKMELDSLLRNNSSTLFFTLNPLNSLFNQHSLEIAYQINRKYYFGIEGGIIKANCWWNDHHQLYDGTDAYYPLGYYNGWQLAIDLRRLNVTRDHWFFQVSPFYKYLSYSHVLFVNYWGDSHPWFYWIKSEKTNVLGMKFLMGKRIYFANHFTLETVFGISIRNLSKLSVNHTTGYYIYPYKIDWRKNILIHENFMFPGVQAGLLLSIGNFKTK